MSVNQRIKYALESKGVSYEDIGKILGITRAAVSNRINSDKEIISESFLSAVAKATGVSLDWLTDGSPLLDTSTPYRHDPSDGLRLEIATLKAEKERLEKENEWLRRIVEKFTGIGPTK